MKTINKDPLKVKTSVGTYFLCLLLSLVSSMTAFSFWLLACLNISLNSGYTDKYLESPKFIEKHHKEHLTIRLCHYIKDFLSNNFWWIFIIVFALCILLIYAMWRATKKNSYVFMKFQSSVTLISGILMILLPIFMLVAGLHSKVKLVNQQNTLLFSAFLRSSCFIMIAIGILLLALAFMEEFLAATILKNRKASYIRAQERAHDKSDIDM